MSKYKLDESIYNDFVNDLFAYATYLGFEKEVAMDAIHDVFYNLFSNTNLFANITNIKYYLFKSLKNRLFNLSNRKEDSLDTPETKKADAYSFEISFSVEDEFIDKEEQTLIKTQLDEMLATLTAKQREIIYLRYIQEHDYEQISTLLNISVHGCRKLVSKALKSLQQKFGDSAILMLFIV